LTADWKRGFKIQFLILSFLFSCLIWFGKRSPKMNFFRSNSGKIVSKTQ